METNKLQSLPPLKRFRLLHQQKHQKEESNLPAKKRKQPRKTPDLIAAPVTTFSLPAKKRIWAFRPDFTPTNSTPSFDLNLEYAPSPSPPRKEERETGENNNTRCESPPLSGLTSASKETDSDSPAFESGVYKKEEWKTSNNNTHCESPSFRNLTSASRKTDSEDPAGRSSESGVCQKVERRIAPSSCKEERETSDNNTLCESGLTGHASASRDTDFDSPTKSYSENGVSQKDYEEEEEEEDDDGILCAICESTDGDPQDPIVFCDGCDLMVHASCYGNPLVKQIPEGDWFCAKCSVSNPPEKCCLCPVSGGAMKPTTKEGKWAHIICALLVPEVFFEDPEGREGINCDEVPKKRWRESCYVCSKRKGCVVECSEPKCVLAFHVTCGLKEDLCIELQERRSNGGIVTAFCKDHTELWKKQQQTGKYKIVAREEHKH